MTGSSKDIRSAGLAGVAALALALAACGGGGADAAGPEDSDATVTTETTTTETGGTDASSPDRGGDGRADGSTGRDDGARSGDGGVAAVADGQLPGEDVITYFSEAGRTANVVGVDSGDVLFVRARPDVGAEEVGRLAPTAEATLAGRERSVGTGLWAEVELSDGVGWVNSSYLAYLPETGRDVTAEAAVFAADSDAATAEALALAIGEQRAAARGGGAGQGSAPTATLVETPARDVQVYRVDILGYPDDSMRGERLEIVLEKSGDGYGVAEATAYPICGRGAADGLCV